MPIQLVVGLGNPGEEYRGTRHNAGADFVAELARLHGISLQPDSKFYGLAGRLQAQGMDLRLLVPHHLYESQRSVRIGDGEVLQVRPGGHSGGAR